MYISPETLNSVTDLVKENGLTVVTSIRFAPKDIAEICDSDFAEIADGKGRWIITDDMASDSIKAAVAFLLGEPDKMIYRYKGGKTIRLKISENGETFEIL